MDVELVAWRRDIDMIGHRPFTRRSGHGSEDPMLKRSARRSDHKGQSCLLLIAILVILVPGRLAGESTRSLIEEGNQAYENDEFVSAEVDYRKALEKEQDLVEGKYNLGGALYKQGRYESASMALGEAMERSEKTDILEKSLFNQGNTFFKQQMYRESAEAYVRVLQTDPTDMDAKYNLSYALKMLRDQEKQQENPQSQSGNEDGNEGEEQKEQGDKGEDEKGKDREDASEDQQPDESESEPESSPEDTRSEGSPEERQISRSEAERILQALRDNEMEVQKKLRSKAEGQVTVEKDW